MSNTDPLFIIGFPRSGTTFLLHLLLSSTEYPVYNFDETHFYSHYYRRYGSLKQKKNFERFCKDVFESEWFKNSDIDTEEFLSRVSKYEYGEVLSLFMNTIAVSQQKQRWVEKTPWHMLFVPEIKNDFPNAKFILIVRDPRDVILSIDRYGWSPGILSGVSRKASAWRWHMEKVMKDLKSTNADYICIKYEDLVTRLDESIKKINDFLMLDIDTEKLQSSSFGVLGKSNSSFAGDNATSDDQPVNRWRKHANKKALSCIEFAIGPMLNEWGYESSGVKPRIIDRIFVPVIRIAYRILKQARAIVFPLLQR